jgi:hypothetical protein
MANDPGPVPERPVAANRPREVGVRSILHKYRERMQHQHGWEVELRCPRCGTIAVPVFRSWTPSAAMNFGNTPTIYADLDCARCGASLRDAAGGKLVELFTDVPIPLGNRRLLAGFLASVVRAPLFLLALTILGVGAGWGAFRHRADVPLLALLLGPTLMWFNWQIASLRSRCACGDPAYKFMGMLGRSYCYRCSTCGRRLRLRD